MKFASTVTEQTRSSWRRGGRVVGSRVVRSEVRQVSRAVPEPVGLGGRQAETAGFQRAVDRAALQSGGCNSPVRTGTEAADSGERFATELNCPDDSGQLACLRAKSPADILAAQQKVAQSSFVYGTAVLPKDPLALLKERKLTDLPGVVGGTSDESQGGVFSAYDHLGHPLHRRRGPRSRRPDLRAGRGSSEGRLPGRGLLVAFRGRVRHPKRPEDLPGPDTARTARRRHQDLCLRVRGERRAVLHPDLETGQQRPSVRRHPRQRPRLPVELPRHRPALQ
ncbi:carboxylesterase family protein [Streptomyces aureus]